MRILLLSYKTKCEKKERDKKKRRNCLFLPIGCDRVAINVVYLLFPCKCCIHTIYYIDAVRSSTSHRTHTHSYISNPVHEWTLTKLIFVKCVSGSASFNRVMLHYFAISNTKTHSHDNNTIYQSVHISFGLYSGSNERKVQGDDAMSEFLLSEKP